MFKILVVNAKNDEDICFSKDYVNRLDADKYYRLFKDTMLISKDSVYRSADEATGKEELLYRDVILYEMDEDKEISKFFIR